MEQKRVALITGASSGIGRCCVARLVERGYRVYAGMRDPEKDAMPEAVSVALDVTDPVSVEALCDRLRHECAGTGLTVLINNAGVVVPGPLEGLDDEDWQHQFGVNVFGVHRVTQACLPLLRVARGRVIMVGSINGRIAKPYIGAYSASKHALAVLSDAWRLELHRWGVYVSLIEPARVETPMWQRVEASIDRIRTKMKAEQWALYAEQIDSGLEKLKTTSGGLSPDTVAQAILRALDASSPRARYLVGNNARIQACLSALLPRCIVEKLILKQMAVK